MRSTSPAEDRAHFTRQDIRRRLGVGVMTAIALLVLAGSWISSRADDKVSLAFVILWLAVLALIVLLLILALADWSATRAYARRHRRQIFRESIESLRRHARESAATRPHRDEDKA